LKNRKIANLKNCLTDFDEIWHSEASQSSGLRQPIKFQKFKGGSGHHLEKKVEKSRYLRNRLTDFD